MDWLSWLIGGGVVVALGALIFVFFKYAKGTAASTIVGVAGGVAKSIAAVLPDDAAKLDVHDVVLLIGNLAEEMVKWANDPTNVEWSDCKEEMLAFVESQRSVIPQLDKLSKETLEKVAEILFGLTKSLFSMFGKK